MISTTAETIAALGISKCRLNELARQGKIPRGPGPDQWDIDAIREAAGRNLDVRQSSPIHGKRAEAPEDLEAETFAQVQLRHEQAKAAKAELIARQMEGSLLDAEDVRKAWSGHIAGVKNSLLLLAPRVAPKLAAIDDVHQVSAILDGEVRRILSELSSA